MKNVPMIVYEKLPYILKSNWIHLLGIYVCIEAMMIGLAMYQLYQTHDWSMLPAQLLLSAPFLMFTWGLIFIGAFYIMQLLLDFVLFTTVNKSPRFIVIMEWIVISPVFIYWAVKYQYWLWIALVIAFLFTQFIRSRRIDRKLNLMSEV
jgi:hypothetical protein